MRNILTILMMVLLLISSATFAMTSQEREAKVAKKKIANYIKAANLSKDEQEQVYQILLHNEQQYTLAKNKYKGNKVAFKSAIKPINRASNRLIKDTIGTERMNKVNEYKKSKREALNK